MSKLYYLGPKGTYSEVCAKKILFWLEQNNFANSDFFELFPVSTISKTVECVFQDENSCAILPIENLIEGIVRQTLDNIYLYDVQIYLQTELEINHCLAARCKKDEIKHIVSHPQALSQCQKYISKNFANNIDLISSSSTADALNFILDKNSEKNKTYGAICSYDLAKDYKEISIISENIGDIKENITRFVLISKNPPTCLNRCVENSFKNTRTSIMFNTKNESGALLRVLKIFEKYNLNLIYLESRPSKRVLGEYNFFADIDKGESEIKEALEEIKEICNYYKFLGTYFVI